MITTQAQAAAVTAKHLQAGKTGLPHAVRRFCKRGLDLNTLQGFEAYQDSKAQITRHAREGATT